jgi:hypothetical protein
MALVPRSVKVVVVEAFDHLYLIHDRRVIERCPVGATATLPVRAYVSPYAQHQCDLCGELLAQETDIGEMHGASQPHYGIESNGFVSSGLVHAQCGLDVGWEVA